MKATNSTAVTLRSVPQSSDADIEAAQAKKEKLEAFMERQANSSGKLVGVGDWTGYRKAISVSAIASNLEYSRECCRQYLGPRMRAVPKQSTVFTPAFMTQLAADNLARRVEKFPYFAKIAQMYLEIEAIEHNI